MKRKIAKTLLGVSSLVCISAAYAIDGTLHATGDVTDSTCAVDVAGTNAQYGTIKLGNVSKSKVAQNYTGIIAHALGKDFYISFKNCSPSERYTLTLSGAARRQNADGTFNSSGGSNAQLTIIQKPDGVNPLIVDARPLKMGPFAVGANKRSLTMDVGLYRQNILTLTYGDLNYDVEYTVDFL